METKPWQRHYDYNVPTTIRYPRVAAQAIFQLVAGSFPDEYRGETVKAFVGLKPGETATDKESIDFCKAKLTRYKVPTVVEFRESLPKSVVGKILRKILRQEEMEKREKSNQEGEKR